MIVYIYIYLDIYIYIYISIYIYIYTPIYIYIYIYIYYEVQPAARTYDVGPADLDRLVADGPRLAAEAAIGCQPFSGPETGKRKRVARKADRKLTLLVNLGGSWHEKLTLLVIHFSLPILAYPFQGH